MTIHEKLNRMTLLAQMDDEMRSMNDEDLIDVWITYGVPDHCEELEVSDLEWLVEDDSEWEEYCRLYERLKAEDAAEE